MKKTIKILALALSVIFTLAAFSACSLFSGGDKIETAAEWEAAIKNTLQSTSAYKIKDINCNSELDDASKPVPFTERNVTITVTETTASNVKDEKSKDTSTTKYYFKGDSAKLGKNYYGKVSGGFQTLTYNEEGKYNYTSKKLSGGEEVAYGKENYELDGFPYDIYTIVMFSLITNVLDYKRAADGSYELNDKGEKILEGFVKDEYSCLDYKGGKYVYNIAKLREYEKFIAKEYTHKNDTAAYDTWLKNKQEVWAKEDAKYDKTDVWVSFKDGKIKEFSFYTKSIIGAEIKYKISFVYGKTKDIVLPSGDMLNDKYVKAVG